MSSLRKTISQAQSVAITTLVLQNASAGAQSAGFITPSFGHAFRQGDIPAATLPKFTLADGTECPATIWGVTTWPDGSLRYCAAMLRVPASIAAGGSLTVNVNSGGVSGSSSRALSDFSAAALSVELAGVSNLAGTWISELATGIADNNEVVLIADGAAGKVWRVGQEFRNGGANHGQLHCWWYVAALENASGGLYGVRYMARVMQPWVDVTSPTPTKRSFTGALKSGAVTVRALQGTTAGEAVGATIEMPHYTSFYCCGADGKWDFAASGGTGAETPVRVIQDRTYLVKSRIIPPYDLSLTPNADSSVNYVPYTRAKMIRVMSTTGEREDIGLLPSWYVRHLLLQTATQEQVMRVTGLASAGWLTCLRSSVTKQILVANTTTYSGMGAPQPNARYAPGLAVSGVNDPVANSGLWSGETESDHRPGASFYPYLITGEPQYLDQLVEQACGLYLATFHSSTPGTFTAAPVTGGALSGSQRDYIVGSTTYRCVSTVVGSNLSRLAAWRTRDVVQAYTMLPDTPPDGAAVKQYLNDCVDASFDCINAYNASRVASWSNDGLYCFTGSSEPDEGAWSIAYLNNAVAHAASITGKTNAATFRDHLARFWIRVNERIDIACAATYHLGYRDENGVRVESLDSLGFEMANGSMSWNATTDRFTVGTGGNGNFNYTPTNGDKIIFANVYSASKPFASQPDRRIYYAVNCSGQTFQLSLTQGGAPLDVTTTASITACYAQVQNFSPRYSFQGDPSSEGYLANTRGAIRHLEACGVTAINPARVAHDANWIDGGGSFAGDPKNAMAASYPS